MKDTIRNRIKSSLNFSFLFLFIFWIIEVVISFTGINCVFLGIYPRTGFGLIGIITAPFIHANFSHLIANSIPFGVLSFLLSFFYQKKSFLIFVALWLTAGLLTWVIGRPSWHIGASIIIYALASFLFWGGMMSRKFNLIVVSLIVFIAYSGLFWGLFPTDPQMSWEGHLSGAISGFYWAYRNRKLL